MIKIELIESFLLVAKFGSITQAANEKSLSPMAMSKQMQTLEAQLERPLFNRTKRQLTLTEFGANFKNEAEKVAQSHASLVNWLAGNSGHIKGTVRVLFQSPLLCEETIIPWMPEFLETYSQLNVEMDVKESLIDVSKDDYDIFWGVSDYLGENFPNLKRRDLWTSHYGVFASPSYIKSKGMPEDLTSLDSHDIIGYLHNEPSNVLVLQENGKPIYKRLNQRVSSVCGLIDLAKAGLGLINAGDDVQQIQDAILNNELVPILEDYWWQEAKVYIYYHNVRHAQPKVKAFIDFFLSKRSVWGSS